MHKNILVSLLVVGAAGISLLLYFSISDHLRRSQAGSMVNLTIVSREEWHAKPPTAIEVMRNPVPYVVIHHSYEPPACTTTEQCIAAMQWMQDFHQNNRSWADIGYHFAVGGDGKAYEGRGWSRVGAHAPGYNNISIGICLIGDWTSRLPPAQQLNAVHNLIQYGVDQGMIVKDYLLFGHRQVREGTECPGDRLFSEIGGWEHYVNTNDTKEYMYVKPSRKVAVGEKEKKSGFVS